MRIERISLQDFRGVESVDVEFDPGGVTIVEGPNETGKTSLADAFDLLLSHKDSAARKEVKAAQPIGRDVGPFVEAELTVGPYMLVYRKRWLREKMTELEIVAPVAEQVAGEAAHLRVLEILKSETDHALFRALRYQQGVEISQAAIAETPSLAAALDAAAGGGDNGAAGESDALLERVDRERLRYFTDKGSVLAARQEKEADLESLKTGVLAAEDSINKLEEAAGRQGRIEHEMVELKAQLPEVSERIAAGSKAVEGVEAAERRLDSARHDAERAELRLRDAIATREARASLIETTDQAGNTLAELREELAAGTPSLETAKEKVSTATKACVAAREVVESHEREVNTRRGLVDLLELSLQRDQLRERHERVGAAEGEIAEAERFLADCVIDEKLSLEIDAAADEVAVARGRAEAGKTRLVVEALQPVSVIVNGEDRRVEPGVPIEKVVSTEVAATIGDIARVVVSPPEEAGEAEEVLARAEGRLKEFLDSAEVASPGEAHELLRERSRRESGRDNARQSRADALRDLERAQLAAKLERAEQRLGALEAEHDPVAVTAEAFENARERARQAEEELGHARSRENESKASLMEVEGALRGLEDKSIKQRTRLEVVEEDAGRLLTELEALRGDVSDEDLEEAVGKEEERVSTAVASRGKAEAELETGDPEMIRATLENNRALHERVVDDLNARRVASAETRTQLEIGGHEGLSDRLAEARAKLEERQREVEAEGRRAAGAERLHMLLTEKREEAQRAYIGPFTGKVNAYGRILFGPGVRIEIDHRDFSITSRTLHGTTVPFELLSGGAREQLAVLSRLACSALVSPRENGGTPGGVPVIIDDALGYSDPSRLEKLGAAFGVAGKDCQVIVLTCEPGRYRGVGGAKVVSLD
jgi:energy-coupling factor transporter ATP-binding protein EcfA2